MIENFEKMIAGSLQLEEPWYIEGARFEPKEPAIHVFVKVRKNAVLCCPNCGTESKRYGYETEERKWRHGDCMFYRTYVHCRRPKVICPNCGVMQISAPFERKNSRFTLMFEGFVMLLAADMPRSKVAEAARCDQKSVENIVTFWVEKAEKERSLEDVQNLAVDETSFKKGHSYVTLVIDTDQRAVIDVQPGKDSNTVKNFAEKLEERGGDRHLISTVTSDMSPAFLAAVKENFPYAEHVIDKFHVKQMLLKALDDVRKEEQKSNKEKKPLFHGRKLFMIPEKNMNDAQKSKLLELSKQYPKTGRAYRITAAFDDFYDSETIEEAKIRFDAILSWMSRSRLEPMKKTAKSLSAHENNILKYFKHRITNAICEGINSLVQATKRKARGYRTFRGYAAMIYLTAGKLRFDVPRPV